jgi:ferredoxin
VVTGKRLAVDWTRCDGHGTCAALEPELVGRDDWGYPLLDEVAVAGARDSRLRRLASVCPAMAMRIEAAPAISDGRARQAATGR